MSRIRSCWSYTTTTPSGSLRPRTSQPRCDWSRLRIPPGHLRHPHELDEQDVRHLHQALKKDRYLESIQAHFLTLPSYRRFPADDEFQRDLQTRDLYNFRSRSYWLRRLENHGRKERVPVDEYTIEHILPQNEDLSAAWKQALGPGMGAHPAKWLHTLGNLTLTGYNAEYSDRAFTEKRDMTGGFKQSPLKLNPGLGELDAGTRPRSRSAPGGSPIGARRLGRAQLMPRRSTPTSRRSRLGWRLHDQRPSASARAGYARGV